MKKPSGHGQLQLKSKLSVLLMLAGALVISGCNKPTAVATAPTPASEQDTNPAANPVYTRPAVPTVIPAAPSGPDLTAMTHNLRSWIARTHRVPADLADYEAQANVQFPAPPPGKKFALGKRMTVVLVSQ